MLTAGETAGELRLNSFFGDTETGGDLALRNGLEFTEDHDLAAAGGQVFDGVGQHAKFFLGGSGVGGVRARFQDGRGGRIPYGQKRGDLFSSHVVKREMSGDLEKEGLRKLDGLGGARLPDAQIRLLHHIVDIAHGGKRAAQIRFELGIVRVHFFCKPAGLIGGGRHRGDGRREGERCAWIKRGVSGGRKLVRESVAIAMGTIEDGETPSPR